MMNDAKELVKGLLDDLTTLQDEVNECGDLEDRLHIAIIISKVERLNKEVQSL